MAKNQDQISPSASLASRAIFAAFQALKENGGELPSREVFREVEKRVQFSEWDKEVYIKTGYTRWFSLLSFFSIDCNKAGFLIKKKGVWYLTPEGEQAMKLGDIGLLRAANAAYKKWREDNPKIEKAEVSTTDIEAIVEEAAEKKVEISPDEMEAKARENIKSYISKKNPYEFQDLCAALLRGMGYYTPFIAPRGKDGGIDVIAYRDPLGTTSPRILVQIKHKEATSAPAKEIRELLGLLQKDGVVGIFISTGGFTPDAKQHARSSNVHVELIDLDRFISLWQDFYIKMSDEDKRLLPLQPVYFLSPDE